MKKLLSIILFAVILMTSTMSVFAADNNIKKTIIISGDVNGNSIVDTDDARTVLRAATGIIELNNEQADVNRDGLITTDDARIILRKAARIQDPSPKTYTEWEITIPPTCINQGEASSYCITDNTTTTKKLPISGCVNVVPATCTEKGYCKDCFTFTTQNALGHDDVDGYCSRCGEQLFESPYVIINNKRIDFDSDAKTLESNFGYATEVLVSELSDETIFYYIYCDDYKKLTIVTLTKSEGVVSVYTLDLSAIFYVNNNSIKSDDFNGLPTISDEKYRTKFFVDKLGTNDVYALLFTKRYTLANNFNQEGTVSTYEKLVFHNTNSCRAINNIGYIEYRENISMVSRAHSQDMAKRNYFSHCSPEDVKFGERLTSAGIEWTICGENICAGYNLIYDINHAWYNSEGHRKIMLTPKFNYIGVGIYYNYDSEFRYYATQNYVFKE